jgi:uncharacterized RDD family membrane protein YckC
MIDGVLISAVQALIAVLFSLAGAPPLLANLLGSLLGIGYFVWMPAAYNGQTVGKMAAGIAIVRTDGSPLSYLLCLGRWAGYLASGLTVGIGFIMAGFTSQKRALHDYIAGTRVIYIQAVGKGRKIAVIIFGCVIPGLMMLAMILSVSVPQMERTVNQAKETMTASHLAQLRQAVNAYAQDNNNASPADINGLVHKYLPALPQLVLPNHPDSANVTIYDASACAGAAVDPAQIQDTGKWGYVADPQASCRGTVFVDCTHKDSKDKVLASY